MPRDAEFQEVGWHRLASWAVVAVVGLFPPSSADPGLLTGSQGWRYAWAVLLAVVSLAVLELPRVRRWLRPRIGARAKLAVRVVVVSTLVIAAAALAGGWSSPLLFLLAVPLVDAAMGLSWRAIVALAVAAVIAAIGIGMVTADVAMVWMVAVLGPAGLTAWRVHGLSIEAGRGAEARSRATRRAELLNVIAATDLTSHRLDAGEITAAVVSGTLGLGVGAAVFYEIDAEVGVYRRGEAAGISLPGSSHEGALDAGDAVCRTAELGTSVVSVGNPADLPDGCAAAGLRSAWAVPVFVDDEVAGVLCALTPNLREPGRAELVTLQVLAGRIAWGMSGARRLAEQTETVGRLKEAERLKADFVSTISQELRAPATVIKGANELLFTAWDRLSASTRDQLQVRIDRNADRLASLLDKLLAYRELDAGRLQPQPEPVHLRRIIADVQKGVGSRDDVDDGGISWTVDDVTVVADPRQLRRVLLILIDNAVVHTPPGTPIGVLVRREGDEAIVTVSDQGPGIDPALLGGLRRPFARAGDQLTRTPGGVGLGLAIADRIVAGHGQHLAIESCRGEGTTCSFRLPLDESGRARLITLPELADAELDR